jgi:hypothetical protein
MDKDELKKVRKQFEQRPRGIDTESDSFAIVATVHMLKVRKQFRVSVVE